MPKNISSNLNEQGERRKEKKTLADFLLIVAVGIKHTVISIYNYNLHAKFVTVHFQLSVVRERERKNTTKFPPVQE